MRAIVVPIAITVGLLAAGYVLGKRLPGLVALGMVAVGFLAVVVGFEPMRRSADHEFEDDDLGGYGRAVAFAWLVLWPCVGLSVGGLRAALRRAKGQETE